MKLVKYNNRVFPNWPSLFDDFFTRDLYSNSVTPGNLVPAVNIQETENDFLVEVAAPGLNKDDFKVEVDNDVLFISAEKTEKSQSKEGDNYTRKEFSYGSFKRSFQLPDTVDNGKINAKYQDGVLRLSIPKREEAKPKPIRQISIS